MGAAEAQVERFSDRIRGGRSWRSTGLLAMMELHRARHEGIFGHIVARIEEWTATGSPTLAPVKEAVRGVVRSVTATMSEALNAEVPVKHMGTTASGGLSNLFHRIDVGGMPTVG